MIEKTNMPDLGLKTPESKEEQEKIRKSVVDCVHSMFKGTDETDFLEKTYDMFRAFGIEPPDESDGNKLERTQRFLKMGYQQVKADPKMARHPGFFDLVLEGKEAYANLYFRVHNTDPLVVEVTPGACSYPGNFSKRDITRNPEANFYFMAEELLGADSKDYKPIEVRKHIDETTQTSFLVTDEGYKRVPLVDKEKEIKALTQPSFFRRLLRRSRG